VRQACPLSCGSCRRPLPDMAGVSWQPLEFKNLPGEDLSRRPRFNSPYHYRLDWEVWIHTTASMDHASGPQAIPGFIKTLGHKVLAGDTDAVGLLGAPAAEVLGLRGKGPPKAIKAEFYQYSFSPWDASTSQWWTRRPIANCPPQLILPQPQPSVRQGSLYRSWSLASCTVGFSAGLVGLLTPEPWLHDRGLALLCRQGLRGLVGAAFLASFLALLTAEYTSAQCQAVLAGGQHVKALAAQALSLMGHKAPTYAQLHDAVVRALLTMLAALLLATSLNFSPKCSDVVLIASGLCLALCGTLWEDVSITI